MIMIIIVAIKDNSNTLQYTNNKFSVLLRHIQISRQKQQTNYSFCTSHSQTIFLVN